MTEEVREVPSLLELSIIATVRNLDQFQSLDLIPEHLVVYLFRKTLENGKLNENNLKIFLATGNQQIVQFCDLYVEPIRLPVHPTRCSDRY